MELAKIAESYDTTQAIKASLSDKGIRADTRESKIVRLFFYWMKGASLLYRVERITGSVKKQNTWLNSLQTDNQQTNTLP